MKLAFLVVCFTLLSFIVNAQPSFVKLVTTKGDIILMLYDETPKHKAMFLQSIKKGIYKNAAFNRIIKSFVSQGGELDEAILEKERLNPGVPVQRISVEKRPNFFHKKGALGAGRNDNPEKSSYINQIYLVAGKNQTDAQLDALERKKGMKFSSEQREIYKTIGGTPHLDQDYTVFGEVVEGMDVAEAINSVQTSATDLPLNDIKFNPVILSKKQSSLLIKKIGRIDASKALDK